MKYIIRFDLKNNVLKADYRRTFVSYFKNAISKYMDGHFYNQMYGEAPTKKSICWSVGFDRPTFDGEKIYLESNKMEMTFKTDDSETALVYFSSLMNMKNKPFNIGFDNQITLRSIRLVRETEIIGNFAVYKILSPICIRLHDRETNKDVYLSCEDENFEAELRQKLKEDLEFMDKEIDSLEFDFSNLKKAVIPTYGLKINVTIGVFFARGNTEVLNKIMTRGAGSRRNSGFGLIESIY